MHKNWWFSIAMIFSDLDIVSSTPREKDSRVKTQDGQADKYKLSKDETSDSIHGTTDCGVLVFMMNN